MEKQEIVDLLEKKHQILFDWLANQPIDNWEKSPSEKQAVSQQILHLVKSLQLLNTALSYPKFILKYKFGTCNRDIRDYDTVGKKYQQKLERHQEKAKAFNQNLKKTLLKDRERLLTQL